MDAKKKEKAKKDFSRCAKCWSKRHCYQTCPVRYSIIMLYFRGRYFVHKRGMTMKHSPGKISFPGGKINPGETALDTAKREFLEETGFQIRHLKYSKKVIYNDKIIYFHNIDNHHKNIDFSKNYGIKTPNEISFDFGSPAYNYHAWLNEWQITSKDPRNMYHNIASYKTKKLMEYVKKMI